MEIKENPFYILEVTPNDTIETINEKCEDKAFMDATNERLYADARQILTSPTKRLFAEVRWFFNSELTIESNDRLGNIQLFDWLNVYPYISNENHFVGEEELLDNPRENLIANIVRLPFVPKEFIASYIIEIDRNYTEACKSEQIYDLIDDINISRRKAKVSLCKDSNVVKVEVNNLIIDIESALNQLFVDEDDTSILKFTNEVAAKTIEKGYEYGRVIEKLIDLYQGRFQELLISYKDKILREVEICKEEYCEEDELNELCEMTRYFDYIAQPIQLLFKDRGQYKQQKESIEVATAIRNLAIYYHNEEESTELSIKLINLELELFSELPDLYNLIQKDKQILGTLQEERNFTYNINEELDELEKRVIHDNKSTQRNKQLLQSRYYRIKNLIANFSNFVKNNPSPDKERSQYQVLMVALYYRTLGVNCTWADMWTEATECYTSSLYWANQTNDQNLINKVKNDLNSVQKSILQGRQQAEREAAEKRNLFYEGEWGLIFKEKVKISQYGLEYKNISIPISEIRKVLWGAIKKTTNGIPTGTDYKIEVCSSSNKITIYPNKSVYLTLTEKLWKASASQIIMNILTELKNGQTTLFGSGFQDRGIHYKETKWFSKDIDRFYTWNEIVISHGNGSLDFVDLKGNVLASYSYFDVYNVHMLEAIVSLAKNQHLAKLSDLL